MDNFIVSARKYRPATFDSVVGQGNITATLKNAIRNKQLAQAFLFTGPRGVGKTTCARILAKTINCMNLNENLEPCNTCESCISFTRSNSFNIHELDAASNNSVEDIRNLVEQVRIPPQVGRYKIYIIDEVHMLSTNAFNAFLKTLEEPPDYAKFILATTEKHKIIPTILSRCQIYDFRRITIPDIISYLRYVAGQEQVEAEEMALNVIAQKADGAMRDALSIFDQLVSYAGNKLTYDLVRKNLNVLDYEYYFKITDFLLHNDITNTLLTFDEIIESGFDGQHFLSGLGDHIRNVLVSKDPATIKLMEVGDTIRNAYQAQSTHCPVGFLLKILDIIQKTDYNYKTSYNKRLHLEIALMQMAALLKPSPPVNENQPDPQGTKKKTEPYYLKQSEQPANFVSEPSEPAKAKPSSAKTEKEQVVTSKPVVPSKAALPGTISIKEDMTREEEDEKEPEEDLIDMDSDEFRNARNILPEEVELIWKEIAGYIAAGQPNLLSTLLAYKPHVNSDFEIVFEVKNAVQEKEIESIRSELIASLREKLANKFIRLKVVVNSEVGNYRPYRPEEIFKYLAEKNPVLITLRQKFNLEPEY